MRRALARRAVVVRFALDAFSSGARTEEREVAKKPKRLLSREQVLDRVPLSYPTILKRIGDEENPFPKPRMIGSRPFWVEDEIDQYITNLPARGDAA